jgi:hypothetical protein
VPSGSVIGAPCPGLHADDVSTVDLSIAHPACPLVKQSHRIPVHGKLLRSPHWLQCMSNCYRSVLDRSFDVWRSGLACMMVAPAHSLWIPQNLCRPVTHDDLHRAQCTPVEAGLAATANLHQDIQSSSSLTCLVGLTLRRSRQCSLGLSTCLCTSKVALSFLLGQ